MTWELSEDPIASRCCRPTDPSQVSLNKGAMSSWRVQPRMNHLLSPKRLHGDLRCFPRSNRSEVTHTHPHCSMPFVKGRPSLIFQHTLFFSVPLPRSQPRYGCV
jgi:hypothetical protein